MEQVNWFDRKFDFSATENIIPTLIERLEGTPARLHAKMQRIDPAHYILKPDGKWSMLEHIGHLADLEPLWQGRLDDILQGQKEMRPTDLNNTRTTEANHNSKSLQQLLQAFEQLRTETVAQLSRLKAEDAFRYALHPRLKTPMRTIDLFTFVAEHDDHHLAKITEIARAAKHL